MLNIKEITKAIRQLAEEKGLDPAQVLEVVEAALAAAYKREYCERGEVVRAKLDGETGEMRFWKVKTVVDESMVRIVEEPTDDALRADGSGEAKVATGEKIAQNKSFSVGSFTNKEEDEADKLPRYNPDRHIFLKEAQEIKPDAKLEEELVFPLETKDDFGRIAAQVAKQTILHRVREAERDSILGEWREKEGQIVSGIVQRIEKGHVYIDFGRTVGVMFANESIPGEHYRQGERLRFFVLAVQEDTRLPGIILSRSHPRFVAKLFEMEVPEIADKSVEIKAITREPGSRTKIAVASNSEGVDPIGACVGQRGTRVMAVNNELGQEKIDIIEWSAEPDKFVANAISPAQAESVEILPRREARVYVPEDQLSLAIGRGGQNVRMAARLTGWKIDVRSQTRPDEVQEGGVADAIVPESEGLDNNQEKESQAKGEEQKEETKDEKEPKLDSKKGKRKKTKEE